MRKVGIELEYAGLDIKKSAQIVQELFSGECSFKNQLVCDINNSDLGDFKIELDAIPLQKLLQKVESHSKEGDVAAKELAQMLSKASATIVPYEIVAPPVALNRVKELERLCQRLGEHGAKSTKDHFYYAFGMHINPEVCAMDPGYILNHIQSFLLLSPWLVTQHQIDLTRRITSYIDPFPGAYYRLVLDKTYQPDTEQLIRDYHQYNPTRDRGLDMTPLFAYLDETLTRSLYGKEEKINKRPTFHYRLPNCEIGNPNWSIQGQLDIWFEVEKLAHHNDRLESLIEKWQSHEKKMMPLESQWRKVIEKEL